MNIFYATFAILRLFVYATFLIKTKSIFQYYYIWIPALATFTHDYFLLSDENSECANHFLYIKAVLSWYAVVTYWRKLDTKNTSIRSATITALDYCKPLVFGFALFAILQFASDNARVDPSIYNVIVTSMCSISALLFLHIAWKPSVSNSTPSFLMFGCVFMLLPLHTTLEIILGFLNERQLLSTVLAQKITSIALLCASQCEGILSLRPMTNALLGRIQWPDLKGETQQQLPSYNEKVAPSFNQNAATIRTSTVDSTKTCVLKY